MYKVVYFFPDTVYFHRQRFSTDNELSKQSVHAIECHGRVVEGAVRTILFKHFTGIEKLCDSYQMCIDKGDKYVEK